jgi:hypothetical protein
MAKTLPDAMWGELSSRDDTARVWKAYRALHQILHGGRTLPDRASQTEGGEDSVEMMEEGSCK